MAEDAIATLRRFDEAEAASFVPIPERAFVSRCHAAGAS
jgi:hypothetical protein